MKIERKQTELTGIIGREAMNLLEGVIGEKRWREYREIYEQASNLEIETNYPIQLDFELNSSCNLKCTMCPLSVESNVGKGKETWFSSDKFKEIIDDGVTKGLKAIKLNFLNEPLIRDDLSDFIAYAKEKGVCDIYLSTNGMLLTEKRSLELIRTGLTRIQISIDAYDDGTYNKVRPGGSLQKVKENIDTLIKVRKRLNSLTPLIRVNFVRTEVNEHELSDFVNFWRDKVEMIGVQEMIKPPKSTKQLRSNTTQKKQKTGFRCSFPFKLMAINCEGDIMPCCTFYAEKMKLGHISKESIEEVWKSEEMHRLRQLHKEGRYFENPVCKACIDDAVENE